VRFALAIAIPIAATTLASLSIPQSGKFVIFAKAYLTGTASTAAVSCRKNSFERAADFAGSSADPQLVERDFRRPAFAEGSAPP